MQYPIYYYTNNSTKKKKKMINGIQHIGIGVVNRDKTYNFYNNALGFSVPMSKNTGKCTGMLPVIGKDEERNVIISLNPHGGGLIEIFQYITKTPLPIPDEVDFSYNGFLFFGVKVKNIEKSLDTISKFNGEAVTHSNYFTPMKDHNWNAAIFRDLDGIYGMALEYPESNIGYGSGKSKIGGVEYVGIGVSHLKESIDFYSNILGYDDIIYTYEGNCPEWDTILGKGRKIKRALLRKSSKPHGLFRHFLGGGMIELIEVEGNKKKHNYEKRNWGDIGFMEVCFDVSNINETLEELTKNGAKVIIPPHTQYMGLNTNATFSYIKDPDGSMLEFADIASLPVPYFMIRTLVNPLVIGLAKRLRILK